MERSGTSQHAQRSTGPAAWSEERHVASEEAYLEHAALLRKIAINKFGIPRAEAETLVHDVFATYLMHSDPQTHAIPHRRNL